MPPYAAGCRVLRSSPQVKSVPRFPKWNSSLGKTRQIEAAKSSRKVVKWSFSTTPNLCPKDTISRAFRAIKNPATVAAGVKFAVHLSCPKHLLVYHYCRSWSIIFLGCMLLIPLSPFSCEFLDNSLFFSGFAFADIFVSKFNALIFLLEVITLFPNKANCKTVFRLARLI